ncbi:hypothetical protein EDD86DRAFT_218106 [Gorgonomyces haynaldii]|nr:hypothetical protein EDD86DRAFT_218106 [Gorgonomyces haynaldii]
MHTSPSAMSRHLPSSHQSRPNQANCATSALEAIQKGICATVKFQAIVIRTEISRLSCSCLRVSCLGVWTRLRSTPLSLYLLVLGYTPSGLNVTVAALDLPSGFAAPDPSDRKPMQKVTVHCPDGHFEEAFVAVLNATAELSPRDYVNQRADHYCNNPSPAQFKAQGFAVPQQLEKRGSWQETLSTFQFYEASRQESVRMHHANLGCPCADSQIISSTVPLSVEKVDFGKYIYAGAECVLTYYPHILAQEGQFRFAYMFRFRKSYLFSTNDVMTYDYDKVVVAFQHGRDAMLTNQCSTMV